MRVRPICQAQVVRRQKTSRYARTAPGNRRKRPGIIVASPKSCPRTGVKRALTMKDAFDQTSRRGALKCLGYGGAGTLFLLSGGVLAPLDLARAAMSDTKTASAGVPLFVQISDSHIGFNKEANPDVAGTLKQTITIVNGMAVQPGLIIHTGDITHLSKAAEFDMAQQLLGTLRVSEIHT